jgi:hypothetical protein
VCGLTGLVNNEPHISSVGRVCYPAKPGEEIYVRGGNKGEVIRTNPPEPKPPETVEDIHKEVEAVRASYEVRFKAAQEREAAALEAKEVAAAAEAAAAADLEKIQAENRTDV